MSLLITKHAPFNIQRFLSCKIEIKKIIRRLGKGTSRQRIGKDAIRKRFPLQKPRWEKTKLSIKYMYTMKTYRKPNELLFPHRWPLSYLNLTKKINIEVCLYCSYNSQL